MSECKRYDLEDASRGHNAWQDMFERPDGDWMKYADHLTELSRLREKLEKAQCQIADDIAEFTRLQDENSRLRRIVKCETTIPPDDVADDTSAAMAVAYAELKEELEMVQNQWHMAEAELGKVREELEKAKEEQIEIEELIKSWAKEHEEGFKRIINKHTFLSGLHDGHCAELGLRINQLDSICKKYRKEAGR